MLRCRSSPRPAPTARHGVAGHTVDEALVEAKAYADETGAVLIHPFDHPDIVAGQGTLGWRFSSSVRTFGTIVICIGGGGLLAGIAVAVRSRTGRPDNRRAGRGRGAYPVL